MTRVSPIHCTGPSVSSTPYLVPKLGSVDHGLGVRTRVGDTILSGDFFPCPVSSFIFLTRTRLDPWSLSINFILVPRGFFERSCPVVLRTRFKDTSLLTPVVLFNFGCTDVDNWFPSLPPGTSRSARTFLSHSTPGVGGPNGRVLRKPPNRVHGTSGTPCSQSPVLT